MFKKEKNKEEEEAPHTELERSREVISDTGIDAARTTMSDAQKGKEGNEWSQTAGTSESFGLSGRSAGPRIKRMME